MEGRAELKVKTDLLLFYIHLLSPYFTPHESAFFFWDAAIENPSELRPSGWGLRSKMGRSQYVKISLVLDNSFLFPLAIVVLSDCFEFSPNVTCVRIHVYSRIAMPYAAGA